MSRHFILDGYNVLHSSRRWSELPREQQRIRFLAFLEERRLTGSERNTVTVVLDGYAANSKTTSLKFIKIVFSGDRDADSVIKERVTELQNPKDVIVVTNDRGLQAAIRGSGARVMSCEDFFKLDAQKPPRGQRRKVDASGAASINAELKRLWKLD